MLKKNYLAQNLGTSIIKNARNSSLPKIIPADNKSFSVLGISAKLPSGPIILPSPGPTTDIEVNAAEIEVIKSYS